MSTYTCPHCGEHGLSTQKRHWCPKAPKISEVLRLGPPRSRDPIANEYIARLTRELEEAREIIRDLVDREPICVALRSKYVEVRIDGGTWDDARRFVGLDLIGDDNMTPPAVDAPAHPVRELARYAGEDPDLI